MISFNDIINVSRLHKSKKYNEVVEFITKKIPSDNIIDFLIKIKNEKFNTKDAAIKLTTHRGELLIYEEDFLSKLPAYTESVHIIDGIFVTVGYPSADFFSDASFIKKIEKDNNIL